MTDDLVKRLRFGVALDEQGDVSWCNQEAMFKAADRIEQLELIEKAFEQNQQVWSRNIARIEKLEAALHQWDDLIRHQYSGSREAMSDLTDAAQLTAELLHGQSPWPEPRIEKLEAALRWYAEHCQKGGDDIEGPEGDYGERARKALEGKAEA